MSAPDRRLAARLHGWRHPALLATAGVSLAAGFAQFGVTAALADVAREFGEVHEGTTVAAQVGLPATTIGIGLGVIRLASLASLPIAATADEFGRRRVLLTCIALGLAITATASLSPSYWWFVAIFAVGRPLLSATNALAGVVAAEETRSSDRAKAIALVTAGYGIGAGIIALVRGPFGEALGFRGLFALALVPLVLLPLLARWLEEPERFERLARTGRLRPRLPVLSVLADPGIRVRLVLLTTLTFSIALITGPGNTNLFLYAEGVLGMSRSMTALTVVAAAPTGLAGLLLGRWASDRLGRRPTVAVAHVVVAAALAVTYSGRPATAVGGYLLSIFAASAYGPAGGALSAELFPTSVRATAAGWLTVSAVLGAVTGLVLFGVLADALGGFERAAATMVVPVAVVAGLFFLLPETRGKELEESAPEPPTTA